MAGVARAWEAAAEGANAERQVVLRTSIVLDVGTPALNRLAFLVRAGLGGRVGSGRQWFSWIHIEDWLAVLHWALEESNSASTDKAAAPAQGVVLATGPSPVRNAELMATMRQVLHRPPAPPTPASLVRLGALLLRTDPALGLTGRRAVSTRLNEAGITFKHPDLHMALTDLLS
jgi:NAD dependent epimerase/dehydratase family enzyme